MESLTPKKHNGGTVSCGEGSGFCNGSDYGYSLEHDYGDGGGKEDQSGYSFGRKSGAGNGCGYLDMGEGYGCGSGNGFESSSDSTIDCMVAS